MEPGVINGNPSTTEGFKEHQPGIDPADTKKNECKPWLKRMWCITRLTTEFRKRMYKVLSLYARPYDKNYPVVCLDEKSKQLIEDVRSPIPLKPGSPVKYDGEYRRKGTRNIFVAVEPLAGRRTVTVTTQRKKKDFAHLYVN